MATRHSHPSYDPERQAASCSLRSAKCEPHGVTRANRLRRTIAASATTCRSRRGGGRRDPPLVFTEDRSRRRIRRRMPQRSAARGVRPEAPKHRSHRFPRLPAGYRETELATLGHPVADPVAWQPSVIACSFAGGLDAAGAVHGSGGIGAGIERPVARQPAPGPARRRQRNARGRALPVRRRGRAWRTRWRPPPRRDGSDHAGRDAAHSVVRLTGRGRRQHHLHRRRIRRVHALDTVVAFTPGSPPAVVAHVPVALRYAAVGSANGVVVIAGGSTPASGALSAIFAFDPTSARYQGRRPSHSAHARLGGREWKRCPRRRWSGLRPRAARHDPRGRSRDRRGAKRGDPHHPRSDAGLTQAGAGLVLVGGKGAAGALATVSALTTDAVAPTGRTGDQRLRERRRQHVESGNSGCAPHVYVPNSQSNTVDVIDPAIVQGGGPLRGRPASAARHSLVGWEDPLCRQRQGQQPHADRPAAGGRRARRSPSPIRTTSTSRPTGSTRLWSPRRWDASIFRDAHSMRLLKSVHFPCRGAEDHMDFTADGSLALVSCEFSGEMLVVDLANKRYAPSSHCRAGLRNLKT